MNDTGSCCECGVELPLGEMAVNYKYTMPTDWPVHFEGVWCRPCSDRIQTDKEIAPKKERTILVLNPGV